MCGGLGDILESATGAVDKVADRAIPIAAPIVGGLVGGPPGAAIGSGFGTLARGGDFSDALKSGALSYGTGALAGGAGGGLPEMGGTEGAFAKEAAEMAGSTAPGAASFYNPFALQAGEEAAGTAPGAASSFNPLALQATEEAGATAGGAGIPAIGTTGGAPAIEPFGVTGGDAGGASVGGAGAPSTPVGGIGGGDLSSAGDEAKKRAAQAAGAPKVPQSIMDRVLGNIKADPLKAGVIGLNLAKQLATKSPADQFKKLGQPISDTAQSLLQQYQSGQINPSTAFDINRWEQESLAAARSYYAKAGLGSSSAAQRRIADIQAQANAMRDQAKQGLLQSGIQAAGIAQGPLSNAIIAQANSDKALSESTSKALQALMLLNAQTAGAAKPATAGA